MKEYMKFNKNMTTKHKKNLTKIVIAFFISNVFFISAFANIDVTANLDSGTYNKVIKVELNTTESWAKTFYGFNPDGWPGDLELYTWAILIKKSTPLVFFSFLATTNESKIKINEYTINYSNDVKIGTWAFFDNGNINDLSLINNWANDVDISYWVVKNDSSNYTFPDNSIIKVWWSYSVTALNWTGTITLFSPDEVKKDSIEVAIPAPIISDNSNSWVFIESTQNNVGNENLHSDPIVHKTTPKPAKVVHKTPTNTSAETPVVDAPKPVVTAPVTTTTDVPKSETNPADNSPTSTPTTTTESTPTVTEPTSTPIIDNNTVTPAPVTSSDNSNFGDNIKNSVAESWNSTWNAMYYIIWLLAFSIIWWISLKIINSKKSWS